MTLRQGALHLSLPEQPHGQRLPIDTFFLSLALECGASAIGIVLSGTGSDGTLGLRAITGAGGIGLVQDPASAQYDGMPTSAINAGAATHVVTPELMPDALQAHIRYPNIASEPPPAPATISGMNQILLLLRTGTGHDFSGYKKSTIGRRIERRQTLHGIEDITHYARYLKEHPVEIQALFRELLINVTSFFRDPEAFVTLKKRSPAADSGWQAPGLRGPPVGHRLRHRGRGLFHRHNPARGHGGKRSTAEDPILRHRSR